MRTAARKDAPQAAIVHALRQAGIVVFVMNQEGLPDLLSWSQRKPQIEGYWTPIEVKYPRSPRSLTDRWANRLTPAQCATYRLAPFPIVDSAQSALALFGIKM